MKLRSVGILSLGLFSILLIAVAAFITACGSTPTTPAAPVTVTQPVTFLDTASFTPTGSATPTFTITLSPTKTFSPTSTWTPVTILSTPTNTVTGSATPTFTITLSPTLTWSPTSTWTPVTIIVTPTWTFTGSPTATNSPTITPTNTPSDTATNSPTITPTDTPTNSPTTTPTNTPCAGRVVTTFAGSGASGSANGTGTAASFNSPFGVAVDTSGNVYVADSNNNQIRKITSAGLVANFGTAINNPYGVAVNTAGTTVYVSNYGGNQILQIDALGVVTTFAGSGSPGSTNATGTAASFNYPVGVAVDSSDNVYVGDYMNNLIREITPAGVVSTVAGQAPPASPGAVNATGTAASFNQPAGVAVDSAGNIYVADASNQLIREIGPGGVVSTLAGSGSSGSSNGTGTAASFRYPYGVAVNSAGTTLYVADYSNSLIRLITTGGVVTTLAGSGTQGAVNANGLCASFHYPFGVAMDSSGNGFIGDSGNNLIREIQ